MSIKQASSYKVTKAISKYNDPKLSRSELSEIIADVTRKGRVSSWEVAMIYGSTKGLFDSGVLKEEGGFIVLAQAEVVTLAQPKADEIDRQIAEGKQSVDPAYRQHAQMLLDCTKGDWLDQLVAEIETEQQKFEEERKVA